MNPKDTHMTVFATHVGLYEFFPSSYGLKICTHRLLPPTPLHTHTHTHTIQRILNSAFTNFLYQWLIIYTDDCIIWSSHHCEALSLCKTVFERAVKYRLQFKLTKCFSLSENPEILGYGITSDCRFRTQKGNEAISAMSFPHNVSLVKRFWA